MTNFDNLFVLDLANNYQGEVNLGLKIIHECAKVLKKYNIKAALKFQFRQLDTFVHPKHKKINDMDRSEIKTQVKNWGRFELVDKVD